MQVNVSARHGSLSGHDQEVIREKTEKVRRLYDRAMRLKSPSIFSVKKSRTSRSMYRLSNSHDFIASAKATTVIAALDGAIQKVEQQLRKHKEKLTGHKSTSVKHITPEPVDEYI
ncbi:MAG: HPF/RaiA family ribosome-associated protein [Pirellulaceae bacterium]